MRFLALPAVLLLVPSYVHAQAPGDRLDQHLNAWERRMQTTESLAAECTRQEVDGTTGRAETFTGGVSYKKPNLAKLDLSKVVNGTKDSQNREMYVATGAQLFEYRFKNKVVRVHPMPAAQKGAVGDDTFLSLIFGMKADEAKKRYALSLGNEDPTYVNIDVVPRFDADKQEFAKGQLALYGPKTGAWAYLPAQLWLLSPNGNRLSWAFKDISTKDLSKEVFAAPNYGPDWRVERTAAPASASR